MRTKQTNTVRTKQTNTAPRLNLNLWVFWNQATITMRLWAALNCWLIATTAAGSKNFKKQEGGMHSTLSPYFSSLFSISSLRFLTTRWETESPAHLSVNIWWALQKHKKTFALQFVPHKALVQSMPSICPANLRRSCGSFWELTGPNKCDIFISARTSYTEVSE